jgi:hypothetical protein
MRKDQVCEIVIVNAGLLKSQERTADAVDEDGALGAHEDHVRVLVSLRGHGIGRTQNDEL